MQKVTTETGSLYVGSKDDALDLSVGTKFDIIWNLASELAGWKKFQAKNAETVLCAQIEDFGIPEPELFGYQLELVLTALKNDGSVFVHCVGGHGRTGMALAIIKKQLGASNQEALKIAKDYCQGPETKEQIHFVEQYK